MAVDSETPETNPEKDRVDIFSGNNEATRVALTSAGAGYFNGSIGGVLQASDEYETPEEKAARQAWEAAAFARMLDDLACLASDLEAEIEDMADDQHITVNDIRSMQEALDDAGISIVTTNDISGLKQELGIMGNRVLNADGKGGYYYEDENGTKHALTAEQSQRVTDYMSKPREDGKVVLAGNDPYINPEFSQKLNSLYLQDEAKVQAIYDKAKMRNEAADLSKKGKTEGLSAQEQQKAQELLQQNQAPAPAVTKVATVGADEGAAGGAKVEAPVTAAPAAPAPVAGAMVFGVPVYNQDIQAPSPDLPMATLSLSAAAEMTSDKGLDLTGPTGSFNDAASTPPEPAPAPDPVLQASSTGPVVAQSTGMT